YLNNKKCIKNLKFYGTKYEIFNFLKNLNLDLNLSKNDFILNNFSNFQYYLRVNHESFNQISLIFSENLSSPMISFSESVNEEIIDINNDFSLVSSSSGSEFLISERKEFEFHTNLLSDIKIHYNISNLKSFLSNDLRFSHSIIKISDNNQNFY